MDNPATEPSIDGALSMDDAASAFAEAFTSDEERETQEAAQGNESPQAEAPPEDTSEPEMVEVDIDGYKVALPKDKAAKLEAERLMQADYTKKTMATAEEKKAAQAQSQQAQQAAQQALHERQQYTQNLQRMSAQLEGVLNEQSQNVDWQRLLNEDPHQYMVQKHLYEQRQAQLNQVRGEQQKIAQYQQAENAQRYQKHIEAQQQELIAKLPEWADESKAKAEKIALRDYLMTQGFDEQTIGNVADARAVVMARKAMMYDQLMSKTDLATKKVATLPTKVERPGVGANPRVDQRSNAFQKFNKSGTVEDAAHVFASFL